METIGSKKWQELEDEFLGGEMDDEAFCRAKGLDLEWFREELRRAEAREKSGGDLFVELVPRFEEVSEAVRGKELELKFRGVEIVLAEGFSDEVFRRALRVIREAL